MIKLDDSPRLTGARRAALDRLLRSTERAPPAQIHDVIRSELGIDLSTQYAGRPIPHPLGKGSGQLSCTIPQVVEDGTSGVAFVVLKTVIAESGDGSRSMSDWATSETRMHVGRRRSREGVEGWTVSWKGRGWAGSLEEYLSFLSESLEVGRETNLLVIPSVKYHLPRNDEEPRLAEYEYTTHRLHETWQRYSTGPLILEKDLSPTLAGDSLAGNRSAILAWLRYLTSWIRRSVPNVRLGVKVMNAMFDDSFQVEMIETLVASDPPPDFLILFNRLFDGERGIAYGGWDLSERNLAALDRIKTDRAIRIPKSATGNICSGRVMLEYALRGCENGQVHTFFQVPRSEYIASGAGRSRCALYTLLLHPRHGLVPWMWTMNEMGIVEDRSGLLHFKDVVGRGLR